MVPKIWRKKYYNTVNILLLLGSLSIQLLKLDNYMYIGMQQEIIQFL